MRIDSKKILKIMLTLSISLSCISQAHACDPHWITAIYDCGEIIQLEDSSLWKVHSVSLIETKDWEAGENIVICDEESKMRNEDRDSEEIIWAHVKRMTQPIPQNPSCDDGVNDESINETGQ